MFTDKILTRIILSKPVLRVIIRKNKEELEKAEDEAISKTTRYVLASICFFMAFVSIIINIWKV